MLRGAALGSRGAMLGSGLGVSQCAALCVDGMKARQRTIPRALAFSGVSPQKVKIADLGAMPSGTYSLWAMPGSLDAIQSGTHGLIDSSYDIFQNSSSLIYFRAGNQTSVSIAGWRVNGWHHIAMTWDTLNFRGFFDGRLVAAGVQIGDRRGTISIGRVDIDVYQWVGNIDDVRIYKRALPPSEIAEHYRGIFSNNDGLVGRWDFDEADGLIAYDKSGYGNHGTLVGNPQRVQVFKPDRLTA